MRLSKRLARVERAAPPSPPPRPAVDVLKLANVLTRLAEGDDSAADGLTDEERHVLQTQFPCVEACRMFLRGLKDMPQECRN